MQRFEGKTFWHRGDPLSLSDLSARDCRFNQCSVRGISRGWNVFSNIHLEDVSHWNCQATGAVFDNISVRNLKKTGSAPLFLNASVFRHVTLVGTISGLKINRSELETLVSEEDRRWRDDTDVPRAGCRARRGRLRRPSAGRRPKACVARRRSRRHLAARVRAVSARRKREVADAREGSERNCGLTAVQHRTTPVIQGNVCRHLTGAIY